MIAIIAGAYVGCVLNDLLKKKKGWKESIFSAENVLVTAVITIAISLLSLFF